METDGRLNTTDERALLVLREAANLDACLDALEVLLRQYFDVDGYSINLHQPADNTLICVRVHMPPSLVGIEESYAHTVSPVNGDNANARVFVSGIPLGITQANVGDFPAVTRQNFENLNMKHLVLLPIQVSGTTRRPIGTLTLFSQRGPILPPTLRRVTRVIEEAAALLRLHQAVSLWEARAHAIDELDKQLNSLLRFVGEMGNLRTEQELLYCVQREFLTRFELDMTAILLVKNDQLLCADTQLRDDDAPWAARWRQHCRDLRYALEVADGASSTAYVYNQHLFFGDIPSVQGLAMSPKDRANLNILADLLSFAIVPIRKQGQPVGLLWLGSFHQKHAPNPEQLALIQHLCDFLGTTIENARVFTTMAEKQADSTTASLPTT